MSNEQQEKKKPRGGNPVTVGLIVVIVIIVAGALAYFALKAIQPAPTPIGEILADLRTYDGMSVTVSGEVSGELNIMGLKAFDLTDSSGTIKVLTERGLPANGETVTVTGVVHEAFNFGGLNYTVILEPAEDQP